MLAEVHEEVAGLLGGPGSVGMCGHAQDVHMAVADLEHEQHVEPPQRYRTVNVEKSTASMLVACGAGTAARWYQYTATGGVGSGGV